MAIAGGRIQLDSTEGMDKITQTEKVTSPYFSTGDTTLTSTNIVTSSLTSTNQEYFFGISKLGSEATEEWNVTYGSVNGSGSVIPTGTKSKTEAIYKQYANLLLAPTEVTGGFFISAKGSEGVARASTPTGRDQSIFVLAARRSNMKDRINKGTWRIGFSGSLSFAGGVGMTGSQNLFVCDDSSTTNPTATPVGDRYNIVSCSSTGVIAAPATQRNLGFFYPDMGIMVFSQQELSASIPGSGSALNEVAQFGITTGSFLGFGEATSSGTGGQNPNTALKFINCLNNSGGSLEFRDEEDQVSAQYFCRVRSGQMNFSNNPTFVSGSLNELRAGKMKGNPQTFITSVQLYNANGDMVAVGNLSTPLRKNFQSEATIKVKLTY